MGRGHLFQRRRNRPVLVDQVDDLLNQAQSPQGEGLLNRCGWIFHARAAFSTRASAVKNPVVWDRWPICPSRGSGRRSHTAVVAQERNMVVLGKKTEHPGHR